ncbi:restriction endonuclease subunit S [Cellulosimicrobium funkei]
MTLRVSPEALVNAAVDSGNPGLLAVASGWGRVPLGEVAQVVNGAPYESRLFNAERRGEPLIRIRDVTSGRVSTWYDGPWEPVHRVEPGAILVGMDGDFKASRWGAEPGLLNQRVCRIDVDTTKYNERFLLLAIQGYLEAIWKATSSITVKHLSSRSVQQIPLPNPPRVVQDRLVEILEDHLSRLDEGAALLERCQRQLAALDEAVIVEALGLGTDTGRIVGDDLPDLAAGWRWSTLADVADVVGGVTKDAKKQTDPAFVEVPYLRVANVQRARLDLSNVTSIRVPREKADALALRSGDVLMNEGGDRDKLARGWIWEGQIDGCIHQNHVFRARPRDDVRSEWLAWCANSYGSRWAQRHGKQSVNLASISLRTIRTMPIPVPPLEVQDERLNALRDAVEGTSRLRAEIALSRVRAESLRRSLLAAAFAGRLTDSQSAVDGQTTELAAHLEVVPV